MTAGEKLRVLRSCCLVDVCCCRFEYMWKDETMEEPVKLPANEYITKLFAWADPKIAKDEVCVCGFDGCE